jgi:hypothetical protein
VTERTGARRSDVLLAGAGVLLGLAVAAGYGAWRAVSREGASAASRAGEFGEALLFPGVLIVVAIAAMVWFGWKANID